MPIFDVQLQKTIVVSVEADTEQEAIEKVGDPDFEDDGAWDRAEPVAEVLNQED